MVFNQLEGFFYNDNILKRFFLLVFFFKIFVIILYDHIRLFHYYIVFETDK